MPRYGANRSDIGIAMGNLGASLLGGFGRRQGQMDGYRQLVNMTQAEQNQLENDELRRVAALDPYQQTFNDMGLIGAEAEKYRQAITTGIIPEGVDPETLRKALPLLNVYQRGGKVTDVEKALGDAHRNYIGRQVTPDNIANIGGMIGALDGKPMEGLQAQLVTKIAGGEAQPDTTRALFASQGKGLYDNMPGGVFNIDTGEQNINDLGRSVIGKNKAQAYQAETGATENLAQASKANQGDSIPEPSGINVAKLQSLPVKTKSGYIENQSAIKKIDKAIAAVKANPDAFGLKNVLGDTVNQRLYSEYNDPRAKIAEIGAVKIHDLTGSAQGVAEVERTKPFVPNVNDTPEAILDKLNNLRSQYTDTNDEIAFAYPMDEYKGGFDIPPPKSNGRINIKFDNWKSLPMSEKRKFWDEYNAEQENPSKPDAQEQKAGQKVKNYTDEDLQETAKMYNMTVEEVKEQLGIE